MAGNKKELQKNSSFEFILQILGEISSVNIILYHEVTSSCHPPAVAEDAPIKITNETELPEEIVSV